MRTAPSYKRPQDMDLTPHQGELLVHALEAEQDQSKDAGTILGVPARRGRLRESGVRDDTFDYLVRRGLAIVLPRADQSDVEAAFRHGVTAAAGQAETGLFDDAWETLSKLTSERWRAPWRRTGHFLTGTGREAALELREWLRVRRLAERAAP